jgi:glycosyltransferase involved in cell wall biosynthesis
MPDVRVRLAVDAGNLVRDARGLGRLTRSILRAAIADPGFDITLLANRRDDRRALADEFANVRVAAARTATRTATYDVVWYPFNGMRFAADAPTLVTIADAFAFTEPHPGRIARAREQGPIRIAARSATRIVTISQWARAEIARELAISPDAIDVLPLGPSVFWFPADRDPLPSGIAGTRYALVVGVREKRKNARLAIEACARALHGPGEQLVIVGDLSADDRAYVKSTGVRAGTIAASDKTLRALYRSASVVLVPSFAEGFGLVAVEAMACGAPVIAANTSALPEATAGAATLLDPRDTDAWAREIRALLDNAAYASVMSARAAKAFAFGDHAATARRMLALLRATAGA